MSYGLNHSEYYKNNPELQDYYESLPGSLQMSLDQLGGVFSTLGELQLYVAHLEKEVKP